MLRTVLNYLSFQDDVQFLAFKQDYLQNSVWKTAFYIHVFSAVIALFAGFTQFSIQFLAHHRMLHKKLGRLYVWNILFVNAPCALVMAIYANGGILAKLAFLTLDFLWFGMTFKAVKSARMGHFQEHRRFMIRSYALTFSAITLRTWKIILTQTAIVGLSNLYVMEAWLGFLPNLVLAELCILLSIKGYSVQGDQQKGDHAEA